MAEVAAIALTEDKLDYGTFELCAPGMLSRVELAEMMSKALGRTVEAGEVPFDALHIPDGPTKEGMKKMFANYDQYGFPGGNALVLKAILGREPRTMQQYINELADR